MYSALRTKLCLSYLSWLRTGVLTRDSGQMWIRVWRSGVSEFRTEIRQWWRYIAFLACEVRGYPLSGNWANTVGWEVDKRFRDQDIEFVVGECVAAAMQQEILLRSFARTLDLTGNGIISNKILYPEFIFTGIQYRNTTSKFRMAKTDPNHSV